MELMKTVFDIAKVVKLDSRTVVIASDFGRFLLDFV